jgi:hypothetical protein
MGGGSTEDSDESAGVPLGQPIEPEEPAAGEPADRVEERAQGKARVAEIAPLPPPEAAAGISLGRIVADMGNEIFAKGDRIAASGRAINYRFDFNHFASEPDLPARYYHIAVSDAENPVWSMEAFADLRAETASFSLFTRDERSGRAPDLYARRFVASSLGIFEKKRGRHSTYTLIVGSGHGQL